MVTPGAKKQIVSHLVAHYRFSERHACRLIQLSRTGYRYQAKPANDDKVRARLKALAVQYPRYGYIMLHALLKQEGLVQNKKHTYRLYKEEGLQVRTKQRKKLSRPRRHLETPVSPNQRWSMDFVADQLVSGRRFRVLNVVDDYHREMVGQLVAVSITGEQVARFLSSLGHERALPQQIVCDNGTEFTSKALFFWGKAKQVELCFIQPGKPTQNAFVESLNGKFRNECLNQHWFRTLDEACQIIDQWRYHYNHERPHSALNFLPTVVFAKQQHYHESSHP